MKKTLTSICLLSLLIFSCTQLTQYTNTLLRPDNLQSDTLTIDITRDTTITTRKGAIIKIPKGSLAASSTTVQLELKEAYTMADIIRGGLATQSNGQPLSSGGMIYINPVKNQKVKIVSALEISLPSRFIENKMQLFKGEQKQDGTVNWTNPQPIIPSSQTAMLKLGQELFINNCATCHSIKNDLTGPGLAHIVKRSPKGWPKNWHTEEAKSDTAINLLYEFTRNNGKLLKEGHPYYTCLFNKWNKTPMNLFPAVVDYDLDALYSYIENESDRLNLPIPDNGILKGIDSCEVYFETVGRLTATVKKLKKEAVDMIVDKRITTNTFSGTNASPSTTPQIDINKELVNPVTHKSYYYQFTITSFGWYNVDILFENLEGLEQSELIVQLKGQYAEKTTLYLIIPSIKAMIPGGPLANGNRYAFFETNGHIPLPQNTSAYIIVMGEYEDQIVFSKQAFVTSLKQSFTLQPEIISKEKFLKETQKINLSDVNFDVKDTPIADTLRKVVKDLKEADKALKPKNFDCSCYMGYY